MCSTSTRPARRGQRVLRDDGRLPRAPRRARRDVALTADHGMNAKTDADRPAERRLSCRTGSTRALGARRRARDPADHRSVRRPSRRARLVRHGLPAGRRRRARRCARRIAGCQASRSCCRAPTPAARFELPADRVGDLVVVSERLDRHRHDAARGTTCRGWTRRCARTAASPSSRCR